MHEFFKWYNVPSEGAKIRIKKPETILLGLSRLIVVVLFMVLMAGLVLYYHSDILNLLWVRPESSWLIWLWHLVSWMLTLILIGISTIFAYLIAQILFSVLIMDLMSRITEFMITGQVKEPQKIPLWHLFFI